MNKEYLENLTNNSLGTLLYDKENIPVIEELLNKESKELIRLKRLKEKNRLDFGKAPKRKELSDIFSEIKKEVDSFLNVRYIHRCEFDYKSLFNKRTRSILKDLLINPPWRGKKDMSSVTFNILMDSYKTKVLHLIRMHENYDPNFEFITLRKIQRAILIPFFSHEYDHHLLNKKIKPIAEEDASVFLLYSLDYYRSFLEGHARGIQRYISELYREKEDNEAFLYNITEFNVAELKTVYQSVCRRFKITPKMNLIEATKPEFKSTKDELKHFEEWGWPSDYAQGNILFYICEERDGKSIYADTLKGDYYFGKEDFIQYIREKEIGRYN